MTGATRVMSPTPWLPLPPPPPAQCTIAAPVLAAVDKHVGCDARGQLAVHEVVVVELVLDPRHRGVSSTSSPLTAAAPLLPSPFTSTGSVGANSPAACRAGWRDGAAAATRCCTSRARGAVADGTLQDTQRAGRAAPDLLRRVEPGPAAARGSCRADRPFGLPSVASPLLHHELLGSLLTEAPAFRGHGPPPAGGAGVGAGGVPGAIARPWRIRQA